MVFVNQTAHRMAARGPPMDGAVLLVDGKNPHAREEWSTAIPVNIV
jgi:hypothetical protein